MSNVREESPVVSEASTWFDLGCALQSGGRNSEALSAFEQAQAIDPNLPFLRHRIAAAHFSLGNFATALDLSEAIVRKNPHDANAWTDICASAHNLRQWDKSLAAGERAFAINPNHPHVLFNYAIILNEFRRFKRARHLLNRAFALDPDIVNLRMSLGLMQLAEGDFKNGWKNVESGRWGWRKEFSEKATSTGPRWDGESLAQKILMIWPELWQGHGDLILFVRYACRLAERAKREDGLIVFCCFDPLHTLFARSLAEHCNELVLANFLKGNPLQPQHFLGRKVVQSSLVSLPLLLGDKIPDKFPYLRPDPIKVDLWRKKLSGDKKFKIGFSWTGRAEHGRNDLRSIPILDLVRALKDIPGTTFYSLQASHPDQTETAKAAGMIDFTRELASFDDTAALVKNLDLVIGIDAVISHLAGAVNVPTWVLVDSNPYWGWQRHGRESLWYRSVRIYRQQKMHRWEEVFQEIRGDLDEAARNHLKQPAQAGP